MADIRCPMCGKSNPENLEVCQHCQARLKPLKISPSSDDLSSAPSNGADGGLPDWLKSDYEDELPFENQDTGDDLLARLRVHQDPDLQGEAHLEDNLAPSAEPEGEQWLQRIRHLSAEDDTAEEDEDSPSVLYDGEIPAWMLEEQAAEKPPEAAPPPDDGIPDWLKSPQEPTFDFSDDPDEGDENALPDWLSADDESPKPQLPTTESLDAKIPDWIAAEEQSTTPAADEPQEIAGNLSDIDPNKETELSDWLESLDDEETPLTTEFIPETDSELPDWIESLEIDEPPEIPADLSDFAPESETDLPDLSESPPDSDGIPDWLSGIEDDDIDIPIILPDPEPETPEWISGEEAAELSWPPEDETSQSIGGEIEPDWLDNLAGDQISELPDFSPGSGSQRSEFSDDNIGDELFDINELSNLFSEVEDENPTEQEDTASDDLAPAELPGWLEAMRPIETPDVGIEEEGRGAKVQTGPLAGLSGVLKAEPEIARLKKSTALTSKLQITESQQNQVNLLRDIIESEGQAIPILQPAEASSQNVLRWLFAFILSFVVGIVLFSESQTAPPIPQTAVPVGVIDTSGLINSLSPQDAVLISFDYEPGTAGEMEAAAAAVVDHLMIKGAYLTLVSTSPTGPALAERFITSVQKDHNYISGNQYINLGYIPGGSAGLLGFVQMPQRITPLSFDGMDAWSTTPLNGIYTLSDFKLVLIITDNPESARMWIEQIQPRLLDTPVIAVASAQAEPILKPYASGENAQVQGMIGGIIDGAAYEQITGKPKLAREYWDALNYALISAIGAIFFGGIANALAFLFKKSAQGEEK